MVIAVMPYVPGKIWTATRYTYMATPFFAILVAVTAGFVFHYAVKVWKPGGVRARRRWRSRRWRAVLVADDHQTEPFLKETERWELLVEDLQANYDEVPQGTTIYVIDDEGLWSNPFWQPTWMTSVGQALYGPDVRMRALPAGHLAALRKTLPRGTEMFVVELTDDGQLVRLPQESVTR